MLSISSRHVFAVVHIPFPATEHASLRSSNLQPHVFSISFSLHKYEHYTYMYLAYVDKVRFCGNLCSGCHYLPNVDPRTVSSLRSIWPLTRQAVWLAPAHQSVVVHQLRTQRRNRKPNLTSALLQMLAALRSKGALTNAGGLTVAKLLMYLQINGN